MTTSPHTGERLALRLTTAALVTLLTGLVAAVFWILAQAQYTNDYCTTRAAQPESTNPEATGGRPAYMDGPYTIACEYDGHPTAETFDPLILLGALFLAAIVIAIGTFRWAWRANPPKEAPKRRTDATRAVASPNRPPPSRT